MIVRINKCSKEGWWYEKMIGEEFMVIPSRDDEFTKDEYYQTVEKVTQNKHRGMIRKDDCDIIR